MPQQQTPPSPPRSDARRTPSPSERAIGRLGRDLRGTLLTTIESLQRIPIASADQSLRKQQEASLARLSGAVALVDDLLSVTAGAPITLDEAGRTLSAADLVTECLALVRTQIPEPGLRMELIRGRHCDLPLRGQVLRYRQVICALLRHLAGRGERIEISAAATPRSDGSAQVEIVIAGSTDAGSEDEWEADRDLLALGRAMLPEKDAGLDQIGRATWSLVLRVPIAARQAARERGHDEALLEGHHVLVVDADQTMRQSAVELLTEMGARCEQARDGLQALEQCRVARFDLILMDLDLPNMDGATATSILVANRLRLPAVPPIIALCGVDDAAVERRGLDAGAAACLHKPLDRERLQRLLGGLLGRSEEAARAPATASQARFLPQRVEETIDLMGGGSEAVEVLQGLVDDFSREVPELLGEIRRIDGAEVGRPRLELVARTLASRSAALGLMAAAALALQMEALARGREWNASRIAGLLERFEVERRAGLAELQTFLQEGIMP